MSRSRVVIWLLVAMIGVLDLCLIGLWRGWIHRPVNLYREITQTEIVFSDCKATRVYAKYAFDGDSLLLWPDGAERSDPKWDSTASYEILCAGRSNISDPIFIDSVWIMNRGTREIYLRLNQQAEPVRSGTTFSVHIDMRRADLTVEPRIVWNHPFPLPSPDTAADAEFVSHNLAVRFYTTVGMKEITPQYYITIPTDRSRIDSVRAM